MSTIQTSTGRETTMSGEESESLFEKKPLSCLEKRRSQFAFLLFGIGMLLPWNAIMAAMDFFEAQFPEYKPQFSLLVAVSVPLFFVQLLVYFFI
jgi:hypothetical protein